MLRWQFAAVVVVPFVTTLAIAQPTQARPVDPVFARAQAMVSDGNAVAGRALVDSVLKTTPPNAPLYAQALFWRASLASNAADAENDYKHIVVDYPLAPQAPDALLRLAQLELARGDREGALMHLQRIPRDYPRSASLARASYWIARVLFEKNDIANACSANANALSETNPDEIELRNQIQYQGQRCPASVPMLPTKATASDSARPAAGTASSASSTRAIAQGDSVARSSPAEAEPKATKPQAEAKDAKSNIVESTKSAEGKPAVPVTPVIDPRQVTSAAPRATKFSVQVAAYNRRPDAEKLAEGLVRKGYEARVDGEAMPFRVRIGRYSTATEAEDALRKLKAKHMDGFVVRAPER
jgi:cell division protein FtsN